VPDRAIDHRTDEALSALQRERVSLPIASVGPVLEVYFPAASTPRDIPHGLGVVPDGYQVLLVATGQVQAVNVHLWTPSVAWLEATVDHTRARIAFMKLQEGVITHVVPS